MVFKKIKALFSETDWRGVLALTLSVLAGVAVIIDAPKAEALVTLAGVAVGFWFGKK